MGHRASDPGVVAGIEQLKGLPIWNVNAGGAAGSSFSLALGGRVLRAKPLKNPSVSQEFRENTGEANLYVWCSWRLVAGEAIASSDQEAAYFEPVLSSLVGSLVESVEVQDGLHDLTLITTAGTLCVFCDHVPPEMSYRINWELTLPNAVVSVGPGFAFEIEEKPRTAPMR
jgi:hypothetical protein